MDEFTYQLLISYDTNELVEFFEVEPDQLIAMLQESYPEKLEENLYKFVGGEV